MIIKGTKSVRFPEHHAGFTLIEVMIAMVVLLIGMLGVMSMQYFSISGNTNSREIRIATNLTHEMQEQLKGTPYATLNAALAGTVAPFVSADVPTMRARTGGMAYTVSWWFVPDCVEIAAFGGAPAAACNIANVPGCSNDPDAGIVTPIGAIRASTCWTDSNGEDHFVSIDTKRWDETIVP